MYTQSEECLTDYEQRAQQHERIDTSQRLVLRDHDMSYEVSFDGLSTKTICILLNTGLSVWNNGVLFFATLSPSVAAPA